MLISSFKPYKLQNNFSKTSTTLILKSKISSSNAAALANLSSLQTALNIFTLPIPAIALVKSHPDNV